MVNNMKNEKGSTLIGFLIGIVIIAIVIVLILINLVTIVEKSNEKHNKNTMPVQEVIKPDQASRVSITEVAQLNDLTLYIVKDLTNGNEYLITQFQRGLSAEGSVATVLMPRTTE